jgi:hypothetical protein
MMASRETTQARAIMGPCPPATPAQSPKQNLNQKPFQDVELRQQCGLNSPSLSPNIQWKLLKIPES